MPSRLATIAIDAVDPEVVADFWCAALGWTILEREPGGFMIGEDERSWPLIDVFAVPEGKTVKNRVHWDVRLDGDDKDALRAKLEARGATFLWEASEGPHSWYTMADPEGNEFCIS